MRSRKKEGQRDAVKPISDKRKDERRTEDGQRYLNMLKETDKKFCWSCGRDQTQRPDVLYTPWILNLAHIAAGGSKMKRHLDRRAVVILCSWCHAVHSTNGHGETTINGIQCAKLCNANTLWLKRERDPDFWSPDWISERWMGTVPEPVRPPDWFLFQYHTRRPTDASEMQ
jgi:hypothetical protein